MSVHFQRRAAMRETATKHGLASGDTLSTYRICCNIRNSEKTAKAVCAEWSSDHDVDHGTHVTLTYEAFTRGVLEDIGPRPSFNFILGLTRPELGYRPGNIFWKLHPSALRRGGWEGAPHVIDRSRDDPFGSLDHMPFQHPLGDCLCPSEAQLVCSCPFAASCRWGD